MRANRGFTLIELMVTVGILAIVAAIAAPSFDSSIRNMRINGTADQLISAMSLARVEAVKRGAPVTLCPSSDGLTCSGTDWQVGYLVTEDKTGSATGAPSFDNSGDTDQRIKVYDPTPKDVVVTLASNASFIRFDALGATANALTQTFTVRNTSCAGFNVRRVVVTVAGYAAIETGTCP